MPTPPIVLLVLPFGDRIALRAFFDEQLSKRRAFLPDAAVAVAERTSAELRLDCEGRSHRLKCEVVYVKEEEPGRGVGVQIAILDETELADLRAFVGIDVETTPRDPHDESPDADANADAERAANAQSSADQKYRLLTSVEQQRLAANGTLSERIVVERLYGPNVWETLLRNTRLTIPEVARIARKGTLPRPLLETIAANGSWLSAAEVQRALLANSRSSTAIVLRILQTMSRADLLRVPQQTAYPASVRQAAKKYLSA